MRFRAGAGRRMSMSGRTVWHGTAVSVFCPAQVLRTPTQFHRRAAPRTHRHQRHHRPGQRPTFDATRRRWTSKAPREPSSRSREPQPRATRAIESYYQRATRWSFLGSTVPRRRGPTPRGIQSHGLVKRSKSLLRVPCLAAVISDPKPPPLPLPPPILRFTAMSVCN